VLSHDVVSHHSTPDTGSRCPWTPKHLSNQSVLPHLYTMPDLYLCGLSAIAGSNRRGQPLITSTNGLDVMPEPRCTTRSW
jgi:hypothetical protein